MRNRRPIYGVGINDADYVVQKFEKQQQDAKIIRKMMWQCPAYSSWTSMLERCFCSNFKARYPTYEGVHCCEEWFLFSKFKEFYNCAYKAGYHLDKDILVFGNKIYSPETCVFVPPWLNNFVIEKSDFAGVHKHNNCNAYKATLTNPLTKQVKTITGKFKTKEDAFNARLSAKILLVDEIKFELDLIDERLYHALIERYLSRITSTDIINKLCSTDELTNKVEFLDVLDKLGIGHE